MHEFPEPGTAIEVTRRFGQADFDEFARISGDNNPIHVDPAFSARTRFGRTVAHGMFLFGVLGSVAATWLDGPMHVGDQRLKFTAPTFTGEDMTVRLVIVDRRGESTVVGQQMFRPDGVQTVEGRVIVSRSLQHLDPESPAEAPGDGVFKGLRPGMRADDTRVISAAQVDSYRHLVDDANPLFVGDDTEVPPALIGGIVSCVLGVDLPGPGTNWLKQHYRFERPVPANQEIRTSVEIHRLRPDKALVDLTNRIETASGLAVTGETLVLAADVPG